MSPGSVFLVLIPLFGFIWYFIVVSRVTAAMEAEFMDRGLKAKSDFGRLWGFLAIIPCCGFIFMILCGLQLAEGISELAQAGRSSSRRRDDDDDDR
ncbi:MAG: hypothetical protein FJ303_24045 [Planctomycetes bacterium]|nr:hypothetical protein [Planctomycetota bacterium]